MEAISDGAKAAGPYATLKAAQDAGAVTLNYGAFLNTLVNLVMRFYELDSGRIELDGVDIARFRPASKPQRPGLRLLSGRDPTEFWFHPDRETALGSVAFSDADPLSPHEELLGRRFAQAAGHGSAELCCAECFEKIINAVAVRILA